jgi:hypothetical protein
MEKFERDAPRDSELREGYDIVLDETTPDVGKDTDPIQERMIDQMDIGSKKAEKICSELRSKSYCSGWDGYIWVDHE